MYLSRVQRNRHSSRFRAIFLPGANIQGEIRRRSLCCVAGVVLNQVWRSKPIKPKRLRCNIAAIDIPRLLPILNIGRARRPFPALRGGNFSGRSERSEQPRFCRKQPDWPHSLPRELSAGAPNGVEAEMKKLYFDIANGANPSSLAALTRLVPVSQLMFGTDFPFVRMAITVDGFRDYKFPANDVEAINRGNALRLFPRLKK